MGVIKVYNLRQHYKTKHQDKLKNRNAEQKQPNKSEENVLTCYFNFYLKAPSLFNLYLFRLIFCSMFINRICIILTGCLTRMGYLYGEQNILSLFVLE